MKKILALLLCVFCVFSVSAKSKKQKVPKEAKSSQALEDSKVVQTKSKYSVQVVMPELENITGNEKNWLDGQIRDKLKSNLQEFLGIETFVDSKSEAALVKIQRESESSARDEKTAIELGKISTAKYALFSIIRKTNAGFIITVDFTDLKTGKIEASATSKEYSLVEYLYGSTGAVDEITLTLSTKLNISISAVNKNVLTSGSSGLSIDEQIALAKENEENYKRISSQYDAEIRTLKASSDILATEDIKRIEAEKALLSEKQQTEKKRQQELLAQKKQTEADAKLEAERSIALKTQRDKMAQEALLKAEEARKLKVATAGILGKINIIEAKKKALVEIRNSVEARQQELFAQLEKDRVLEEQRIRAKSYSVVELDNGKPTEAAKERRENQVIKSYEDLTNKFFVDAEAVKQSTMSQQNALLSEINADLNALKDVFTVSSIGDELKVNFGTYSGSQNGWNAYLSLYSDGVLLFTDIFIVGYEAVSGKKAPNMSTELDDVVIEEYANNVDMYNSLLTRGSPILTFEIDTTACVDVFKDSSSYRILFKNLRVKNTISGKIVQTNVLNKDKQISLAPVWDLQEKVGIVEKEKEHFSEYQLLYPYLKQGMDEKDAKKAKDKEKETEKKVEQKKEKKYKKPFHPFWALEDFLWLHSAEYTESATGWSFGYAAPLNIDMNRCNISLSLDNISDIYEHGILLRTRLYSFDYFQNITEDDVKIQSAFFSFDFGPTIFEQVGFYVGGGLGLRYSKSDKYDKDYTDESDYVYFLDLPSYDKGWECQSRWSVAFKANTGLIICAVPFTLKFDVQYNNIFGFGMGISVGHCWYR